MVRSGEPEPFSRAIVAEPMHEERRLHSDSEDEPRATARARRRSREENAGRAEAGNGVTTEKEIFRLAKP